MILICDRSESPRSERLREHILKLGYPCALSTVAEIRECLPVRLIITYCDLFDDVRRTPWESIFVIAIGQDFVNTALNAKRADSEDMALELARQYLLKEAGVEEADCLPFGVTVDGKYFFADGFFEIYGNRIVPTPTEYRIFRHLFACSNRNRVADAEKIFRFCLMEKEGDRKDIANHAAVHIANLNRKLKEVCGKRLIRAKRNAGYYFDPLI